MQIAELNNGYKLSDMKLTVKGNKNSADIDSLSFRIEGNKVFKQGMISLENAHLEKGKSFDGHNLKAEWTTQTKKHDANHEAFIESILVNPLADGRLMTMKGVSYGRKTHTPRKNKTGIPDFGNMRVEGDLAGSPETTCTWNLRSHHEAMQVDRTLLRHVHQRHGNNSQAQL